MLSYDGSHNDRAEIHRLAQDGDVDARNKIVEANIGLVVTCAASYARRNPYMHMDDLIQSGHLGLIRASEKFDHTMGIKFSTYAMYWIRKEVRLEMLSSHGRGRAKRTEVDRFLSGRLDPEREKHYREGCSHHQSIDAAVQLDMYGGDFSDSVHDLLVDKSERGHEDAETRIVTEQIIDSMIDNCTHDEVTAMWMFYGVAGYERSSPQAISKELGMRSAGAVRLLIDEAMEKVRIGVCGG